MTSLAAELQRQSLDGHVGGRQARRCAAMASWQRRQERVEGERQRIVGVRRFWAGKEDAVKKEASVWTSIYCTIRDRRRSKSHSSLPRAASWGSRTPSTMSSESDITTPSTSVGEGFESSTSTSGAANRGTAAKAATTRRPMRSKSMDMLPPKQEEEAVEEEVVTDRRYLTTCYLAMKPVPVRFSSSVHMRIGSTRKTFTEHVLFRTRLVPLRFSETLCLPQTFGSASKVPSEQPPASFPNLRRHNGAAVKQERFV